MFRAIHWLTTSRIFWLICFLGIVGILAFAYYLQVIHNLQPCYYCVKARFYLLILAIVCLFGVIYPNSRIFRSLTIISFTITIIYYLLNSIAHYQSIHQIESLFKQCSAVANLPFLLEKLFPSFFGVRGLCNDKAEVFGFDLVEISLFIAIFFLIFAITLIVSQLTSLKKYKKRFINRYY